MVRTDMTVPVARLAADRCDDEPLPLRFSYMAPASAPGRRSAARTASSCRPAWSCSGCGSAAGRRGVRHAALRRARGGSGCATSRVTLGSVAFQRALIDSLGLRRTTTARRFMEALADRDYPLLESIAGNADVDDGRARARCGASSSSAAARPTLGQARKLARSDGMEAAVGAPGRACASSSRTSASATAWRSTSASIQDLTYYTGLIVEAFAPGVGLPLATGGRYDGLLARFDWDIPGVGFAVARRPAADALDEAGVAAAVRTPAALRLHRRPRGAGRGRPSCAAPGWPSRALPDGRRRDRPPLLVRRGGGYTLRLAGGREVSGGAARHAPGAEVGMRIGLACEAGAPPAELLALLEAAGLPAASLREEVPPALVSRRRRRPGSSAPPATCCAPASAAPSTPAWSAATACSRAGSGVVDLLDLRRWPRRARARARARGGAAGPAPARGHPVPRDGAAPLRRHRRAARRHRRRRAAACAGPGLRRRRRRARLARARGTTRRARRSSRAR